MLTAIHHVQLAMPSKLDGQARAFYGTLLGLQEVAKPTTLAKRGGIWFEGNNIRVHLGIEKPFRPAKKAHPAFEVTDLNALYDRLSDAGVELTHDDTLPGYTRFYAKDPFGNRIEFLQAI